jgi:hypothetical protein
VFYHFLFSSRQTNHQIIMNYGDSASDNDRRHEDPYRQQQRQQQPHQQPDTQVYEPYQDDDDDYDDNRREPYEREYSQQHPDSQFYDEYDDTPRGPYDPHQRRHSDHDTDQDGRPYDPHQRRHSDYDTNPDGQYYDDRDDPRQQSYPYKRQEYDEYDDRPDYDYSDRQPEQYQYPHDGENEYAEEGYDGEREAFIDEDEEQQQRKAMRKSMSNRRKKKKKNKAQEGGALVHNRCCCPWGPRLLWPMFWICAATTCTYYAAFECTFFKVENLFHHKLTVTYGLWTTETFSDFKLIYQDVILPFNFEEKANKCATWSAHPELGVSDIDAALAFARVVSLIACILGGLVSQLYGLSASHHSHRMLHHVGYSLVPGVFILVP